MPWLKFPALRALHPLPPRPPPYGLISHRS
jgi:hypothetical protein